MMNFYKFMKMKRFQLKKQQIIQITNLRNLLIELKKRTIISLEIKLVRLLSKFYKTQQSTMIKRNNRSLKKSFKFTQILRQKYLRKSTKRLRFRTQNRRKEVIESLVLCDRQHKDNESKVNPNHQFKRVHFIKEEFLHL